MNDIIKRYIRITILYVAFFICGCAVTYFAFPRQKVSVSIEKQGRVVTNSVIAYRYISTNERVECSEYIDQYNHILGLYKGYTGCVPFDATNNSNEIYFSLGNEEITNRYAINYHVSRVGKKVLSLYITGGMRGVSEVSISNACVGVSATLFDFVALGASIGFSGADVWVGIRVAQW